MLFLSGCFIVLYVSKCLNTYKFKIFSIDKTSQIFLLLDLWWVITHINNFKHNQGHSSLLPKCILLVLTYLPIKY